MFFTNIIQFISMIMIVKTNIENVNIVICDKRPSNCVRKDECFIEREIVKIYISESIDFLYDLYNKSIIKDPINFNKENFLDSFFQFIFKKEAYPSFNEEILTFTNLETIRYSNIFIGWIIKKNDYSSYKYEGKVNERNKYIDKNIQKGKFEIELIKENIIKDLLEDKNDIFFDIFDEILEKNKNEKPSCNLYFLNIKHIPSKNEYYYNYCNNIINIFSGCFCEGTFYSELYLKILNVLENQFINSIHLDIWIDSSKWFMNIIKFLNENNEKNILYSCISQSINKKNAIIKNFFKNVQKNCIELNKKLKKLKNKSDLNIDINVRLIGIEILLSNYAKFKKNKQFVLDDMTISDTFDFCENILKCIYLIFNFEKDKTEDFYIEICPKKKIIINKAYLPLIESLFMFSIDMQQKIVSIFSKEQDYNQINKHLKEIKIDFRIIEARKNLITDFVDTYLINKCNKSFLNFFNISVKIFFESLRSETFKFGNYGVFSTYEIESDFEDYIVILNNIPYNCLFKKKLNKIIVDILNEIQDYKHENNNYILQNEFKENFLQIFNDFIYKNKKIDTSSILDPLKKFINRKEFYEKYIDNFKFILEQNFKANYEEIIRNFRKTEFKKHIIYCVKKSLLIMYKDEKHENIHKKSKKEKILHIYENEIMYYLYENLLDRSMINKFKQNAIFMVVLNMDFFEVFEREIIFRFSTYVSNHIKNQDDLLKSIFTDYTSILKIKGQIENLINEKSIKKLTLVDSFTDDLKPSVEQYYEKISKIFKKKEVTCKNVYYEQKIDFKITQKSQISLNFISIFFIRIFKKKNIIEQSVFTFKCENIYKISFIDLKNELRKNDYIFKDENIYIEAYMNFIEQKYVFYSCLYKNDNEDINICGFRILNKEKKIIIQENQNKIIFISF